MTGKYLTLILSLSAGIALVSGMVLSRQFDEATLRIFIAWSAKLAAILFAIAFGVSSVHYFINSGYSKAVLYNRPMFGLSFVVFHTAHLIFLLILQMQFHPVFNLAASSSLIGGGLAYVFMYSMFITTFPYFRKKLSVRNWHALHLFGGWWIWFIFYRSYFKNVFNKGEEYLLFALFTVVLILRLFRFLSISLQKRNQ